VEDFAPVLPVSGGFPKQPLSNTALAEIPAVTINLRRETWLKNSVIISPYITIYFSNHENMDKENKSFLCFIIQISSYI
jgi:hypothetical protein